MYPCFVITGLQLQSIEKYTILKATTSLQQNTVTYKSISLLYIFDLHKFHTTLQSP